MPSTAIMWFRRDLRVHDLPALAGAAAADRIVPLFVFDERLLKTGRFPSANRTAFMLGCLRELDAALRDRGAQLVVHHGRPEIEIPELARDGGAADVPDSQLAEPWKMSEGDQQMAGCVIGSDYPDPIVDHAEERRVAQDRYRGVSG